MASVSYGLNRGNPNQPQDIVVGTLAITTDDIELRWDNTKSLTTEDIILACQAFIRRLEGSEGSVDAINI